MKNQFQDDYKHGNLTIVAHDGINVDCHESNHEIGKSERKKDLRPAGYVEIFDQDKNLVSKSNLVTYQGREWLLSRAFKTQNVNISQTPNEYIGWLGLGSGGCDIQTEPFVPIPPTNNDTNLSSPIANYMKSIDSLVYVGDVDNYGKYLIGIVTVVISVSDVLNETINEAGLYTAESAAGPFNLYAKITFPSIFKTNTRELTFVWYLYF